MNQLEHYYPTITFYTFECPLCGFRTLSGSTCLRNESSGKQICNNHLPARKLIPLAEYQSKKALQK